ncbi:MAG TPA: hypothetical protein VLZ06_12685 [Solirubrobacteraceae bacterium]|nr:hypothetical protein [Solirubrobacteraceae bacterium]
MSMISPISTPPPYSRTGHPLALPGGREQAPLPESPEERELVAAFADAREASDVGRIVSLLTEDAWVTMPPSPLEYQGHEAIAAFFGRRGSSSTAARQRQLA